MAKAGYAGKQLLNTMPLMLNNYYDYYHIIMLACQSSRCHGSVVERLFYIMCDSVPFAMLLPCTTTLLLVLDCQTTK